MAEFVLANLLLLLLFPFRGITPKKLLVLLSLKVYFLRTQLTYRKVVQRKEEGS